MAMIVQHNLTAMNTNRQLGISTNALAKSTEKLSSGYRINRAADDAAGLAISEKMRSQIRGLDQASTNASDGISMIQTAEGALNESHSILQRMRELAVQAANGTETDEDRDNIQDEIEQLQEELDRIASDTEFNTMKLLDGSLSAAGPGITGAGPKFGEYDGELGAFITSDVAGVVVKTATSATTGGESAIWDPSGKTLTLNLTKNVTYTQTEIDKLVAAAKQEDSGAYGTPANVSVQFANGVYTAKQDTDGVPTAAGKKSSSSVVSYRQEVDASGLGAGATNSAPMTIKSAVNGLAVKFNTIDEGLEPYATYATADKALNVYLTEGETYTQEQLNNLLVEAGVTDTTISTGGTVAATTAGSSGTAITVNVPLANSYTFHDDDTLLTVESTVLGAGVTITGTDTVAFGKETAVWDETNNILTLTLNKDTIYTQEQINDILERTVDTSSPARAVDSPIKLTLDDGATYQPANGNTEVAEALDLSDLSTIDSTAQAVTPVTSGVTITNDTTEYVGANVINITSNRYGADHNVIINLEFTAAAGKECAELDLAPEYDMGKNGVINTVTQPAIYTLSLQSGKEYTADEIEDYLAAAGLDMTVELSGNEKNGGTDEPNTLFVTRNDVKATIELRGGAGIGDEDAFLTQANYGYSTTTGGIILQVGANEGQTMQFSIDDMSAAALGVNGSRVDVSTQKQASDSLGHIDEAIQRVSKQRSLLGAVQNRLEHTIANLDNTAENLQDAESGIRDVDMASEMVTMSKYNILQQAGQAMLAQANQATQGVLSLIQS